MASHTRRPTVGFAGYSSSVNHSNTPLPSRSPQLGRTLSRAKTLTRPDRFVQPAPLLNPHLAPSSGAGASHSSTRPGQPIPSHLLHLPGNSPATTWWRPWSFYIYAVTIWAPSVVLAACGMKERPKQRAWREKVALCSVALVLSGAVGYVTIGLQRTLCPVDATNTPDNFISLGQEQGESSDDRLAERKTG